MSLLLRVGVERVAEAEGVRDAVVVLLAREIVQGGEEGDAPRLLERSPCSLFRYYCYERTFYVSPLVTRPFPQGTAHGGGITGTSSVVSRDGDESFEDSA